MKQLFQKINVLKVLNLFFKNPRKEFYLREIARSLKMSPATVLRALTVLEETSLISKRKEKHAVYFKAALTPEFKELKKACTLAILRDSGIVEFIREKSVGLSCILLYGSAAKGEDDKESDFDFLVVATSSGVKSRDLIEKLGREVNLRVYSPGEWKHAAKENRGFYLDVIAESIALFGNKPVVD